MNDSAKKRKPPVSRVVAAQRSSAEAPPRGRQDWIRAGLKALSRAGVSGVRVEALARELGVTKGSFYWHFARREELLLAVLDTWEALGTHEIIRQVEALGGDARARLLELWAITSRSPLGPELAIRDWSRTNAQARARVQRVDRQRLDYLSARFAELGHGCEESEQRALLMYSLLIGAYFVHMGGTQQERQAQLLAAVKLLLE